MKLSVVIITFNEEDSIGRCIDSVKNIADEIVVLDSISTDKTVSIAESKGAKVYLQPFLGYIEQKNKALEFATHEYVLCLDADEAIDHVLEASIQHVKALDNPKKRLYDESLHLVLPPFLSGTAAGTPDRKLRLFKKSLAFWGGTNPHDKVVLKDPQPVTRLKGDLLHYSYHSIAEHVHQNNRFSTISAESMYKQGKKTSMIKVVVHPSWAFILSYILRLGFLDGFYGFVIAIHVAQLSFLKHAKLYQKYKYPD